VAAQVNGSPGMTPLVLNRRFTAQRLPCGSRLRRELTLDPELLLCRYYADEEVSRPGT